MGQVALTLMIMPESPETDIEAIKKQAKKRLERLDVVIKEIKEKPVAFGLKMLEILLTFPDRPGGTDAIEHAISEIDGVASVEAGDITLL
ncbi:MAG: elongation factor 1-beta [Candidatus Aenigmarchaeota archaeon]|nr:elongation factor 1-beta [Candidatus Aenigmarchaeota archaeon]